MKGTTHRSRSLVNATRHLDGEGLSADDCHILLASTDVRARFAGWIIGHLATVLRFTAASGVITVAVFRAGTVPKFVVDVTPVVA
jgi:hypothetical protein